MGLFTNNKKLCPICGSPTPRLLASAVEGQNLCKECAAKIDLPDGVFNSMTLDDFREYIKCYDANKPLRDSFTETYRYDFGFFKGSLLLDMDHQLLRLGVVDTAFALEPSDIKSFRILEEIAFLQSAVFQMDHIIAAPEYKFRIMGHNHNGFS